jgi:hypothetical protein
MMSFVGDFRSFRFLEGSEDGTGAEAAGWTLSFAVVVLRLIFGLRPPSCWLPFTCASSAWTIL